MAQEIYLHFLFVFLPNSIWLTKRDTWMKLVNALRIYAVLWGGSVKDLATSSDVLSSLFWWKEKTSDWSCHLTLNAVLCTHTHVLTPTQISKRINKCSTNLKKNLCKSQQNGSAGKGPCWQVWGPNFILRFLSPKLFSDPHTCAIAHLSHQNKYERKICMCKLELGL